MKKQDISNELHIATVGWDKPIPQDHFPSVDRTDYIMYPENGTPLNLVDLVDHVDFSRADFVVIDADVLREIKNKLQR